MDMEATQRCMLFTQHVAGALPTLGRAVPALGQLPRAALEAPLRDLATTLDFTEPLASLQVRGCENMETCGGRRLTLLMGSRCGACPGAAGSTRTLMEAGVYATRAACQSEYTSMGRSQLELGLA